MEADFWLQKWRAKQIGFHADDSHPLLVRYWDTLALDAGARVFAPLCGKSLDLVWLRAHGHTIVGVELSPLAIEAFFVERGLTPDVDRHGPYTRYRAQDYELLCGDFFALTPALLGACAGIYDRAALIALPPTMRDAYAAQLTMLAPRGARMLLITVQYELASVTPPPFAIDDAEVARHYQSAWHLTRREAAPTLVKEVPAQETVFSLERR